MSIASVLLFLAMRVPAYAASAWNPTLLVNTEAFQIIDNSDTAATQLEIRFGDVVGQRLFYDRTNLRFQFTRNIFVAGDVTATGSITAMRVLSGQSLRVSDGGAAIHGPLAVTGAIRTDNNLVLNDDADSSNVVLTFGSDAVNESLTWLNTADKFYFSDDVDVGGTLSGASIHAAGGNVQIAENGGSVFNIYRNPDADFQVDAPATPKLFFVNSGTQRVGVLSTVTDPEYKFDVWWSGASDWVAKFGGTDASGDAQTRIGLGKIGAFTTGAPSQLLLNPDGGNVGIGVTTPKATLAVQGIMSGVTLYSTRSFSGAGLTDCDIGASNKLLWDATTGRFSCGTDQTGGGSGGNWSNTGSLQGFFDTKYVNVSGDTMTGALVIDVKDTTTGTGLILREKAYFGSGAVLSGALLLQGNQNSRMPSQAPAGMLKTYSQDIANRQMFSARSQFGSGYSLQPALFSKMVMMLSTGGGTTVNGYGTTVTNDTTVSHPAADQTFGYMTNFATAATLNDTAGTSSVNTTFFRGSTGVANGFFFHARVGVVDVTSIRTFVGLANQTIATMVGNDNPAGHTIGFQFSTNRADANWQFQTKDNTTQNVINTTIPFTANHVYDLSFYCSNTCTTVYWQVDDVTFGTTAEGSTASNLPGASTSLRQVLGVSALTATAKNIRMQHVYTEADR